MLEGFGWLLMVLEGFRRFKGRGLRGFCEWFGFGARKGFTNGSCYRELGRRG